MAREKKLVNKVQMTDGKHNIIRQLHEEYDVESVLKIQEALKDLIGGTIKKIVETEMADHPCYNRYQGWDNDDTCNDYKIIQVNSSF